MNKINIDFKKIVPLLVSGSLSFSLLGCVTDKYMSMEEMFHDTNEEGIDDSFERIVSDSDTKVNDIVRLEKSIKLVKELMLIDYSDIIPIVMNSDYESFTDEDIKKVEDELFEYQTLKYSKNKNGKNRDDALLFMKRDLYQKLIRLINYIEYRGGYDLYHFGDGLYSSIILDELNYEGNEKNVVGNAKTLLDFDIESSAWYSMNDNYESIEIDFNSQIYKLILETNKYVDCVALPGYYHFNYSYTDDRKKEIKEMLEEYEKSIKVYKESMVTDYHIEEHEAELIDDFSYDYDIKCGKPDIKLLRKER